MAQQLPTFLYSRATCGLTDTSCVEPAQLDWIIGERWNDTLKGIRPVADSVLAEWGMAARQSLLQGERQIFLYVAPCLDAIELALCMSMEIASINCKVFDAEVQSGKSFPSLPRKIRIDERLGKHGCCQADVSQVKENMKELKRYLKSCASNERRIPQMERMQLTPLHSGPWTAQHFDIAYLDRRCYEMEQENGSASFNLKYIRDQTPNQQFSAGNMIISTGQDLLDFAAATTDNAASIPSSIAPGYMFKLDGVDGHTQVAYFGEFEVSRYPSRTDRPPIKARAKESEAKGSEAKESEAAKPDPPSTSSAEKPPQTQSPPGQENRQISDSQEAMEALKTGSEHFMKAAKFAWGRAKQFSGRLEADLQAKK